MGIISVPNPKALVSPAPHPARGFFAFASAFLFGLADASSIQVASSVV
jgi:hypothetical protein